MKIDLKKLLVNLLPLFFKLATQIWVNLTSGQRAALTTAVQFAQFIKTNLTLSPSEMIDKLAIALSLPTTTIRLALTAVAYSLGHPEYSGEDVIKYYQDKANSGLDDLGWANLWDTFSRLLAPNVSREKIDWDALALGAVKIAFDQTFGGK